jgi:CheY-like chemotaxis protein
MPYIDGFDMLKALRGDPITQAIPVIVVSSLRDIDSLGRVAALRANGFVYKPIQPEKLVESVEQVLSQLNN